MYEGSDALNASGLPDPTARDGIRGAERAIRDERRREAARQAMGRCALTMRAVARSMGYEVVGRIELRDPRTGEVSR